MAKYTNKELLAVIGKKIGQQRLSLGLEPEDIAEMTGFTANTIRNIEEGQETSLSYFVAVCLAIDKHPKDILDIALTITPRFPLSASRKEKSRLTARIEYFIENNFFQQERTARDIVNELAENYKIKSTTSAVSVILNRKVEQDVLESKKKKNVNLYKSK